MDTKIKWENKESFTTWAIEIFTLSVEDAPAPTSSTFRQWLGVSYGISLNLFYLSVHNVMLKSVLLHSVNTYFPVYLIVLESPVYG